MGIFIFDMIFHLIDSSCFQLFCFLFLVFSFYGHHFYQSHSQTPLFSFHGVLQANTSSYAQLHIKNLFFNTKKETNLYFYPLQTPQRHLTGMFSAMTYHSNTPTTGTLHQLSKNITRTPRIPQQTKKNRATGTVLFF